jgi:spermidine/putrescine-binding protein
MSDDASGVTRRDALKQFGAAGVAVSAASGIAASVARAQSRPRKTSAGTVNYFTYSVYSVPAYFTEFTKQTGITVTASNYGEEEELEAKLRATRGEGYDVINVNNAIVGELAEEGLLLPIDRSRIPNWKYVFPRFQNAAFLQYKGKYYGSPGVWGPDGIMYRTDLIKQYPGAPIDSWDLMWYPGLSGKLETVNDNYEMFLIAGMHLGLKDKLSQNPIELTTAEYAAIKSTLIEQVKLDTKLWTDLPTAEALLASGDSVAGLGRIAFQSALSKEKVPTKLVNPKEGALAWANGTCISAATKNVDACYELMNFLLSPTYGGELATTYGYSSPSQQSMDALPAKLRNSLFLNDPNLLDKLLFWEPAGQPTKWANIWNEVLAAA